MTSFSYKTNVRAMLRKCPRLRSIAQKLRPGREH
jgi:hypothetical protein